MRLNSLAYFISGFLLVFLSASTAVGTQKDIAAESPLSERFVFASKAVATQLLTTEDSFTDSWSQFDIESRLNEPGSRQELLDRIGQQSRAWSKEEQDTITRLLNDIGQMIAIRGFNLSYPGEIALVKTTGQEEGGASGYTRSNYIVLAENGLGRDEESLKRLLIHELFHILSRHDAVLRESLYRVIGFDLVNTIDYPVVIEPRRITNPDADAMDHSIRLHVAGEPVDVAMILFADREFEGGSFFEYLNTGFMELQGDSVKQARLVNGKPVIHSAGDVSGFREKIGANTRYMIHPEEIMAENFADTLLMTPDMPSPHIIDAISEVLAAY